MERTGGSDRVWSTPGPQDAAHGPDIRPVIGVSACLKQGEHAPFHSVMDRYVEAVVTAAGALPVIVPAIGRAAELPALLDRLDGVLLTGSPSNVCPSHYDGPPPRPGNLADPRRDATTLPLIRLALAAQVPLFAICRGIQELNVALGGTLHQHLHEVPGRADHRSDKTRPYAERYEPRHPVTLVPGGRLQAILGVETRTVLVNSLHAQGIDRLAPGLVVEAVAEDGTIEAVSVAGAAFALGVQWHPEWRAADDPVSRRLFAAFGAAARARARARTRIR